MRTGKSLNLLFVLCCVCISISFHNCKKTEAAKSTNTPYSFFIAGHVYGHTGINNPGVHPPFRMQFDYIRSLPGMAFGVFTGDIVSPYPQSSDWDEIDADVNFLGLPVHFTAGNHDMENRPVFEYRYGPTYYHFFHQNDLFIVLDPNLNNWNISGDQLNFLHELLQEHADYSHNIFVFFHQMLWWDQNNQYSNISVNSTAGRADSINFWTEIEPMFNAMPNNVTMFCGDLGAASWANNIMYDRYDNITLVGSGMGNGTADNFILVTVDKNNVPQFEVIRFDATGARWRESLWLYELL